MARFGHVRDRNGELHDCRPPARARRRPIGQHHGGRTILGNFSAELSNQSDVIRDSLRRLYERWTKDVEATIAEAQEQGAVSDKITAADLAAFLLDAYEGALLRARVERDNRAFDRFMKFAFTQLLV